MDKKPRAFGSLLSPRSGPTAESLSLLFDQLALAARAGLPTADALAIVGAGNEQLSSVAARLHSGASLSASLRGALPALPAETLRLIEAAEETDSMPAVYEALARDYEHRQRYANAMTGAFAFPVVALVVWALAALIAAFFIVPVMQEMFAGQNMTLPLATRLVADVVWLTPFLVAFGLAWRFRARIPSWDRWMMRTPYVRAYLDRVFLARASVLLVAIAEGAPARETLAYLRATCGNRELAVRVDALLTNLQTPRPFADALRETLAMPAILRVSAELGSRTGSLPAALRQVVPLSDAEAATSLLRLQRAVLVATYAVAGVLVGFTVIALYLPIFFMGSAL